MSFGEALAPFLGRVVLAWYFLSEAYARAIGWNGTVQLLSMKGVPAAPALHFVTLVVMVLCSFALFLGFRTKFAALVLFAFTQIANALMNDYWTISDPIARQEAYDLFARNLAIAGGLLILMGLGAGKFALDNTKWGK
jgi:putative oxidoreductase